MARQSVFRDDPYEEGEEELREILGYKVERRDPYGFWHILKAKDPRLQGSYTSIKDVEIAIQNVKNSKLEASA